MPKVTIPLFWRELRMGVCAACAPFAWQIAEQVFFEVLLETTGYVLL